jgi:FdhD protein
MSGETLTAPAEGTRVGTDGRRTAVRRTLVCEHRLALRVDGEPFAKLVCTPAHLRELVLGRLLTDGRITSAEDVLSLEFSEAETKAEAKLRPGAGRGAAPTPTNRSVWRDEDVFRLTAYLRERMPLHEETAGTHGAALMHRGEVLCCCEDIGRHNAVDKAVGTALARGVPLDECILCTTGRVAADIAQKAATAGIPVLVSRALPTAEAVQLAAACGMTLIGRAWEDQFEIYTNRPDGQ